MSFRFRWLLEQVDGAPEEIVWRALEYMNMAEHPPGWSAQYRPGRQESGNHWGITRTAHVIHLFMDRALERYLQFLGVI